MGKTSIEWLKGSDGLAGYSWNALRARRKAGGRPGISANHCEHVNEACRFCYAESLNARLGGLPFKPGHRKDYEFFIDNEKLTAPLRMRKPTRIFVESMSDAFGDWWPSHYIDALYSVMALSPQHTYINLSKRPERRRRYLGASDVRDIVHRAMIVKDASVRGKPPAWPLPNVIEGTSVSCQAEADEFVPILLQTKAALRCVSAEPLLGPIDFTRIQVKEAETFVNALTGEGGHDSGDTFRWPALSWAIVGGESGPSARPTHPAWVRSIWGQFEAAGVSFFFKQWGAWAPHGGSAKEYPSKVETVRYHRFDPPDGPIVYKVGKSAAGRLLDGAEHNGFPAVAR